MSGDQPRELIITVYGLYARGQDNWLSVAALVKFISGMGMNEPAVRSSIYRLKQSGILSRMKVRGVDGYALSPSAVQSFAEGDTRIFRRRRARLDDGWLLISFSIPESERATRHMLRSELVRLGFGNAAPALWVAPGSLLEETKSILKARGVEHYVYLFRGDFENLGDLDANVQSWWDVEDFNAMYRRFIERFKPVLREFRKRRRTDAEAFCEYVRVVTSWRLIKDPGLPLEVLPAHWQGTVAAELFSDLRGVLEESAARYAHEEIARSAGRHTSQRASARPRPT
jgi:phenylacetic acid degradation operon negative regulatory protein